MPDNIIYGTSGNDALSGGNGKDTIYGGDGDDVITGGNGVDTLFGDGGNDQVIGDNGDDKMTGGAGDDMLEGKNGFDTAYYSRTIGEYWFLAAAGYLHVIHLGGAGPDGHDRLIGVERLVFADRVIDIGSGANAPVAGDDLVSIDEDAGVFSSGGASVLDNDFDFDGDPLTVADGTFVGSYGTLTLNADGTYRYTLFASTQQLAQGESVTESFNYTVSDNDGSDAGTLQFDITGTNDGPVANPEAATTGENAPILIDVLANDSDIDNGATLTVTAASAPPGEGTASVVGNQVEFDPGSDFDDLAVGESEAVVVSYTIEDEHGASASSTITVTVTGTNDGPVANPEAATTGENAAILIDVLANDSDVDNGATLTVTAASAPPGEGTASIVGNQVEFDPGSDFDYLTPGETAVVILTYTIEDEHGAQSSSTVTVTVEGPERGSGAATEGADTLFGTSGNDTMDALGGDDTVFGRAGNDTIYGRDGSDVLNGQGGDDVLDGGNDDDFMSGNDGSDRVLGQAGNDVAAGGNGADQLSGGDGFDILNGEADDDVLAGGNDDDVLQGGEGDDQLLGEAGNDAVAGEVGNDQLSGGIGNDGLDGGDGDDTLDGGDGNDFLGDFVGINSFAGGIGDDVVFAGSSDGAQTIDGGDGNDTLRHYYRHNASTITTGSGSDTIELTHMNQGRAAIVVTDFTPGAGGDKIQLSGDDGSLLSLLSGWEGSNPFGSGFLRLQQSGADTFLEWDQDGASNGTTWETLVVFQNTTAGDFTSANFAPGYDPDGSASSGDAITGTADGETLTGTVGADTIDAQGGDDRVFGLAGDDQISGGDGFDSLYGEAGNDVIEGGNDDDFLWGGNGADQLSGGDGFDILNGEADDDQLTGAAGDDSLYGGGGDDALAGGEGGDFLFGGYGADTLSGGAGADGFYFSAAADGTDEVTDFLSGADTIYVSSSGFGGGLLPEGRVSLVLGSNPTASDATGQFLFDTDDGRLYWDADGTSSEAAVLVAMFSDIPSLQASDFLVI